MSFSSRISCSIRLLLVLSLLASARLAQGGSRSSGTPANTYSVTVTATSGNSSSNTTLTVTVQ